MQTFLGFATCTVAVVVLALATAANADVVLAQTDFGTTPGTDVSPFLTSYAPFSGGAVPGHYDVDTTANHSFDWGGVDHTTGTGCFMVVDGALDSGLAILSHTADTVAGYQYTLDGWVQNVLSGGGSPPTLSFRVNGAEMGSLTLLPGARIWTGFSFTYMAATTGPTTFTLHDNIIVTSGNDFGLDDIVMSSNIPEPATLALLALGGLALLKRKPKS